MEPIQQFLSDLAAQLADGATLTEHATVPTRWGDVVLDCIVSHRGAHAGFWFDLDTAFGDRRREWEIAATLGSNALDVIYEGRASQLGLHRGDMLYALALLDPWLFAAHAAQDLAVHASPRALGVDWSEVEAAGLVAIPYTLAENGGELPIPLFLRHSRLQEGAFWRKTLLEQYLAETPGDIEAAMRAADRG